MSAPTELVLTPEQEWRSVPMPGANLPLELVRLASPRDRFTIHGRFPAGFERLTPGGYVASEEVVVLDGELELEGTTYGRGDLVVVPAGYVRTDMRSPRGCRVLAWFGGPAVFLDPSGLPACDEPIVAARAGASGELPATSVSAWARDAAPEGDGVVEVVAADLSTWRREDVPGPGDLARRER